MKKSVSIICCVGFDLLIYSTNNEPVYVIEYLQREISDLLDVVATEFANQVQLQLVFITIPEVCANFSLNENTGGTNFEQLRRG